MGRMRLILASESPRRRDLLRQLGVSFEVCGSGVDEVFPEGLAEPGAITRFLARRKALAVATREPDALVLGADTLVFLDGEPLGKPSGEEEARRMLERLQGRSHLVCTGCCLAARGAEAWLHAEETRVWMRPLTPAQIDAYIRSGEPLDKAGAYAIQGLGASLVTRIEGCFYNVVGLPLAALAEPLGRFGHGPLAP